MANEKQYHIALGEGELADYIILVGDPGRSKKTSKLFDEVTVENENREFITFTGKWKGTDVSVMSTGIGPSNVEIALIEICQIVKNPTFIRVGSCGGLQEFTNVSDLVISSASARYEDTSLYFVDEAYPSYAHYEVILALLEACEKLGYKSHLGITASASGFYGAQGRELEGFPIRNKKILDFLAERNVYNFEMESSTLFTLASLKGLRAGTVCAVYANRPKGLFISNEEKPNAELRAINAGLEAVKIIQKMDQKKKENSKALWLPSFSL